MEIDEIIFSMKTIIYIPGIQHIDISELTPLEAKAGDLIIFDTNCIHAGGDKFEMVNLEKLLDYILF